MKIGKKKKEKRNLEIGICCRNLQEHYVMLTLIVVIQHIYRKKYAKKKRVYLKKLLEKTTIMLDEKDATSFPFKKKKKV